MHAERTVGAVLWGGGRNGQEETEEETGTGPILFGPILAQTNRAGKYRPGNCFCGSRDSVESSEVGKNGRNRAAANDTRRWAKTVG